MKLNKMMFLILFIAFNIILNNSIPIKNGDKIIFGEGITEYKYEFSVLSLEDLNKNDIYFFFKFSSINGIAFKIIDENKNENKIEINNDYPYIHYKIINLKPQKFTFVIKNDYEISQSMIFIDNSKEIYYSLEKILNLGFETESIKTKPPLPLIFNVNPIEEEYKIVYINNSNIKSNFTTNDRPFLEYCEIGENKCNFKNIEKKIIFEKGKNYKIRLNSYKNHIDSYLFNYYGKSTIIKEVRFGFHQFILDNDLNNYYYILDAKKYSNFYIYICHKNSYVKTLFANESEINLFKDNIDYFNNNEGQNYSTNKEIRIYKDKLKDYLIINIFNNDTSPYKGFVYFFNWFMDIQYEKDFEMKEELYGLIKKKIDIVPKKYILVSSNKNIGLINSEFNIEALTNIILLDNSSFISKSFSY